MQKNVLDFSTKNRREDRGTENQTIKSTKCVSLILVLLKIYFLLKKKTCSNFIYQLQTSNSTSTFLYEPISKHSQSILPWEMSLLNEYLT